ncbi:tetratricopeptide repeat protein [Bacteroidales bacterium OttesenSCG-928-A17]|nr:tetratricopeptide repeat protein [Bacteroidales bacterium OttesenSCG-928-A17]
MAKKVKNAENAVSQAEANVGQILSRSEQFIENYKNHIIIGVTAIILIVVAVLGVRHAYYLPKEKEAQAAIFPGENYFAEKQWETALNGDSISYFGFLDIIDEYGFTKTGKLAKAYAGICFYHLGKPEEAMKYLKSFNPNDHIVSPVITGLVGDCYVETGNVKEGANYFIKAAEKANNTTISPIYLKKAATAYESLENYKAAISAYQTIKSKYPNSLEAQGIDKYIVRAESSMK